MSTKRASALVLRITATLILIVSLLPIVMPDLLGRDPRMIAWSGLLLSIGAFAALLALAALIQREASAPPEVRDALGRIQQHLIDLDVKLKELQLMSDRAARAGQIAAATPPPRDYTNQLQQIESTLSELREISLLPDAERKHRLQVHRQQRKSTMIKDLFGMVAAHEWSRAERQLITLETEFPNDDDVAKGRSYLDHSRRLFEEEAMEHATAEIEELMAAGAWDRAWERVNHLIEGFPQSGDAHALFSRVQKERETYRETTVQRMFDEIRHDIDRRMWQRALLHAERLLEQFPEHRLADRVREQIMTLQDNAEIQERQEMEVRIQELMRAQQFEEAIELAEDVIRRFPSSPQAESLEVLLPRIRELARESAEPSPAES